MSETEIFNIVEKILKNECLVDSSLEISKQSKLIDDLFLDSINQLTLLSSLENHFQMVIEDTFDPPQTVGDIVSLIKKSI
ncbi:phosphopantetheine-binding protein [Halobacteriovorax sp. GB3]|uniref:acyl carrier protein n=1 Tax=Halobacteriovorax sp. GB3 TaxID=2719615 RepID=UPI0023615C18|nr:phosphopantetheine-binding protein [Halobacteriovorax sp. GB3]MDD0852928.1 phosphopantetheine-binding protein [Halobacteriovorax sp. GB3]